MEKKTKKHRRTLTVMTKPLKEELFKMWVGGKTIAVIHESYLGTDQEFCLQALNKTKQDEDWDKRRNEIDKQIEKKTNEDIVRVNVKKVKTLNDLVGRAIDIVNKDNKRYLDNPEETIAKCIEESKPLPLWFVTTIKDLAQLLKLHNEMVNGKGTDPAPGNLSLNQFNIVKDNQFFAQDTQSKLLDVLSKEKFKAIEVIPEEK